MKQSSPDLEWPQTSGFSRSGGTGQLAGTTSGENSWSFEMLGTNQSQSQTSVIPDWRLIPHWRDNLSTEIAGYIDRSRGWDGYEARPIERLAIADALRFVAKLPDDIPPPLDQPCTDGEVSLVWRYGTCFAEIGFPGDETFYWYCTNGTDESSNDAVSINDGIPVALSRLMGFTGTPEPRIQSSRAPAFYRDQLLAA